MEPQGKVCQSCEGLSRRFRLQAGRKTSPLRSRDRRRRRGPRRGSGRRAGGSARANAKRAGRAPARSAGKESGGRGDGGGREDRVFLIRPLLEVGVGLGWSHSEVRAASLADFFAAWDGYLIKEGHADPDQLSAEDVAELQEQPQQIS